MISSGRIASDHAAAAPEASSTMRTTSASANKPFDHRGSQPPPTGAGPDDEFPQLIETGAVPANACPQLNELMLVALALLYGTSSRKLASPFLTHARSSTGPRIQLIPSSIHTNMHTASFVGPLSLVSLAYFVCALIATPMCIYAACKMGDRPTDQPTNQSIFNLNAHRV